MKVWEASMNKAVKKVAKKYKLAYETFAVTGSCGHSRRIKCENCPFEDNCSTLSKEEMRDFLNKEIENEGNN